ncbi:hypothetical protein SK128_021953, partial [Halocaridina rubra]
MRRIGIRKVIRPQNSEERFQEDSEKLYRHYTSMGKAPVQEEKVQKNERVSHYSPLNNNDHLNSMYAKHVVCDVTRYLGRRAYEDAEVYVN